VLLDACRDAGVLPRVIFGMGEVGFPTQVLASKLGSAWCYASPTAEAVAPAQVATPALEEVYRFRSIGPGTQVFGVIGNPVMHSRSPSIHNRGFTALGIDAVYLPFHVPDLQEFWKVADSLGIRGLSVTVPHKTAVLGFGVEGDADVRAIGACNTLTRASSSGPWTGANTDMEGFLAPLRQAFGGKIPAGLRATVIGAGGAARSVVAALASVEARVLVLNRTVDSARRLAEAFQADFAGLDAAGAQAGAQPADLVVQTTSAGMAPQQGVDPAPGLRFTGREIVYELVYAPSRTPIVLRASAAGCRVIRGWQMLLAQARRQFLLFTGAEYPPELMEALSQQLD
jgi:3-dehydroquinate dehydratase/shikimate dehydrogenase